MSDRYRRSRFVQCIPRLDGWAAYHSLFGNLALLDASGKDFLDAFASGGTVDEVARRLDLPEPRSRSYANLLIGRYFLIPDGADDYSLIEEDQQFRRDHLKSGYLVRALQLVTANACNYKCRYCFMDMQDEARNPGRERGSEPMTPATAEASVRTAVDLLRQNGNGRLHVEFFGGEPLLNWPAIRHVLTAVGTRPDPDVEVAYSITTNGALIDREMARMFRDYAVTVTVSIDIPVKLSGLPVVMAKSGDRVRRSLALLRDAGAAVTFNSVISTETIASVDGRRLIDFARSYGVGVVGLILDLALAFYRSSRHRTMVQDILLDTHRYGREQGVRVMGYWHQIFSQIIGEQPINLRSGYKTCPATGVKLSVEPDGSVHACKCTSKPLGTIARLDQVLSSSTYAAYAMEAYRHAPECEGCPIEGFCSGVCMGSFENEFRRRDMVETGACDIFRTVTRELIVDLPGDRIPRLDLRASGACP